MLNRAQQIFYKLKMNETKYRTGVLIYMACKDRKIAILGDAGINQKVAINFWDEVINTCLEEFKKEKYFDGLIYVLDEVAQILQRNFPSDSASNFNEISNDISYGDDE